MSLDFRRESMTRRDVNRSRFVWCRERYSEPDRDRPDRSGLPMSDVSLSLFRRRSVSHHFNPTVAKQRDRGVFSCADRETEPLIPRFSKGLRRWVGVKSLTREVTRDPVYSHAWPAGGPIPPKISAVSLSHGVRVIRGLASLFRSQPPRVGFGVGKATRNLVDIGSLAHR